MPRPRTAALVAVVVIVAALAAAAGFVGILAGRDTPAAPRTSTPPLPSVAAAAGRSPSMSPSTPASTTAPVPTPAVLARTLAPYARAAGLGSRLLATIVDVGSGATLYDRSGSLPAAPASTAKLLTAAAVLRVHAPTDRFTTTVRQASAGTLVLVGGGDPTLTAGTTPAYPGAASIRTLAAQLKGRAVTRIVVDDSLFGGPTVSPAWAPDDLPSDYASPITPIMVDGGRAAPSDIIRSLTPDLAAGRALAAALGRPSLPVTRGRASGPVVASVRSAPVGTLVAQMLLESDNVIAEVLARQVAIATHRPATFTGAAAAVRAVLAAAGDDPGAGMVDGSGLAASDRLAPAVLARLLRIVATTGPRGVLTGLPVAAWSGTLADRYLRSSARGDVRAKTGTLAGVSTLAGYVHDRDGRLLAFALVADRAGATQDAEAALDALVTALAGCGCR